MRLLQYSSTRGYHLTEYYKNDEDIPPYAILSHTWGADGDEVTFKDLISSTGANKPGHEKIRFCAAQARQDDLDYFWIDTCCIDQDNGAELSHAINSMFRWYRNAVRCYVYLSDVSTAKRNVNGEPCEWGTAFRRSRWFTRGWTLQELLAPRVVEFFSRQRKPLGDRLGLSQQIHEITAIPEATLQGELLSQFSVSDRMKWITHRKTKHEEDKAYSLLGIFGVYMPPLYGEGIGSAFGRLQTEIKKLEECTRDLHVTDPQRDKSRIEETKGGLLEESYCWIFQNTHFLHWRNDPQSRLLWIKGDPGKGKTMLLCGIINELGTAKTSLLSYFFCQATDLRINSATAVLRGLLFMIVSQQPALTSHLRKKYDQTGKALFEDANAWFVLCEIFTDILQDPSLDNAYFFIDALDECVKDQEKLLAFIVQKSSLSPRVKWILTSRNYANIEQRLRLNDSGARLSLELKENAAQVSRAVGIYLDHRLKELEQIQHDEALQSSVREKMQQKANGTFLWVSLVMKELKDALAWEVLQVLDDVPTELADVYRRMMKHIKQLKRRNPELCRQILSTVVVTYRPLHLQELCVLADLPNQGPGEEQKTAAMVNMCGSFLTVREDHVFVIHQSAQDFLLDGTTLGVFPSGTTEIHRHILSRSIQAMSRSLQRDMYRLGALGYPIDQVQQPKPDPLAASRYSCIYWIDHLCDWSTDSSTYDASILRSGGIVDSFIRKKFLYWLEALSICKSMSKGVVSMAKLTALVQEKLGASDLSELVHDARRFIMYHKVAIEEYPLQTYASALFFSPTGSLVRDSFKREELDWITIKPAMEETWSSCLQTLEGHKEDVGSMAFSADSTRLVSASLDGTIKIWVVSSGECINTLENGDRAWSVAFSPDLAQLASAWGCTVKIWDASSGACLRTLEGHEDLVNSVAFSRESSLLASGSNDSTVKLWDTSTGKHLQTLKCQFGWIDAVAFSHDSARLASVSQSAGGRTVQIWDINTGACLQTLVHGGVTAVAFSHDSVRLVSASSAAWSINGEGTVKIWDASSSDYPKTFESDRGPVDSIAFSHDSALLALGLHDCTVELWDAKSGEEIRTFKGHGGPVISVAFSHDSAQLATASEDLTVKLWDVSSGECFRTPDELSRPIIYMALSHNSTKLASASEDGFIGIWDTNSMECLQNFEGHSGYAINSVAFSHDSAQLASASYDQTSKLWDLDRGVCLQKFEGHSGEIWSSAFSQDSSWLATVSQDRTVKIWDTKSSECLRTLEYHGDSDNDYATFGAVVFSNDSSQLASASLIWYHCKINIWDTSNGECFKTLKGHDDSIASMAFSPDSARLASSSEDGTVKLWDVDSGACLQTLVIGRYLERISFDVSGSYLHTDIGVVRIGAPTGSRMLSLQSEPAIPQFEGVSLSADGVWIKYNSENLLRLPSEYWSRKSVVSGQTIGIGAATGRVWICKVQLDALKVLLDTF